ncbi:PEP-CTERM sorting domain-containing protein [Marinobacter mangrovi]|uniref:PEP-CTERM sorting domain-containing protein n=1 Tax=Marinobacter mangrovi TaxID=2803918 RepID=UPI00193458C2|nr:PEP-CTERM sorting domain-containing protein [Marinobacter mangrovi]
MGLKHLFIGAALILGISPVSYGYLLADNTDVGGLDTFVAATTKSVLGNANPTTEENWVESVLGYQVTYADKTDPVDLFVTKESSTVVAFALTSMPGFYVVKDGQNFMLFSNNSSMDWGVLDLAQYFGVKKLDGLTFSHVTEFNGHSVSVPEPGSSALLGLGLLALVMLRLRSRSASV